MSTAILNTSQPFEFDPERHLYSQNGKQVLSVTQVLAKAGVCDFSFVDEETRIHSMKRGQSVHWMLQLEDEGALNYRTVPRSLRGYRKAYREWKRLTHFQPLWIEKQFVSDYGYAGTIDRAGSFPASTMYSRGTCAVIDFKTGEIPGWVRYQLCAYSAFVYPEIKMAEYVRRIALSLRPDGTYKVREFPLCTWLVDWAKFNHHLRSING